MITIGRQGCNILLQKDELFSLTGLKNILSVNATTVWYFNIDFLFDFSNMKLKV
jgi:hypothetical protein